jgi:AmmeMemoRadiSam system protein B
MMAEFYQQFVGHDAELVIVIGPNHFGINSGLLSYEGIFETYGEDVSVDENAFNLLMETDMFTLDENDIFSSEHSLNIQMQFLVNVMPEAKVLPILIGEAHNEQQVLALVDSLRKIISEIPGNVLVIGTVDFAHFQNENTTLENDELSAKLIDEKAYDQLIQLDDSYIDSPSVLVTVMKLLESYDMILLSHSNSKEISGYEGPEGITSYRTFLFVNEGE